jgi:hypothetical protein
MAKYSFFQFLREQWGRPVPLLTKDLTGKVVLVTGANIGLGFEAAKHFASMNPERLIVACRSEAKGSEAIKGNYLHLTETTADHPRPEIKEATKFDNIDLFLVDLASYASVNAFCEKVEKEVPRLDILVENAALAHGEFIPTPDGWEHQWVLKSDRTRGLWLILSFQAPSESPRNCTTRDPAPSTTSSLCVRGRHSSLGLCFNWRPLRGPTP